MCYAKTGRLLETKTGNFNLAKNPKALQSPLFVRNYLNLPGSRRICSKDALFTCGTNGGKIFSRAPADQISQLSFQLVARTADLRLDRAIRWRNSKTSLTETSLPATPVALQTSLKSNQVHKTWVSGIRPGRHFVSQLTSFPSRLSHLLLQPSRCPTSSSRCCCPLLWIPVALSFSDIPKIWPRI